MKTFSIISSNFKMALKVILAIAFIQICTANVMSQTATAPSAGDGSVANPYQIATLNNLYWLSQQEGVSDGTDLYWSRNYIQTADINASASNTWDVGDHDNDGGTPNEAMGFSPIGGSEAFKGRYNGQGFTISNLYINRHAIRQGLFGHVNNGGTIDSLGLIDVSVSAGDYDRIGALVGVIAGNVNYCYSTGTVSGGSYTGGLVGSDNNTSVITNSYSYCNVSTAKTGAYAGGLIGTIFGTVNNCYSTGTVSGSSNIGGFAGYLDGASGSSNNCFWDTETSSVTSSATGTGKTTTEMKNHATFTHETTTGLTNAWDFISNPNDDVGNNDFWDMDQDITDYPILSWQGEADNYLTTPLTGSGTQSVPYEIATLDDLQYLSEHSGLWDKHFIQTADINAATTSTWNSGAGFSSIGTDLANSFTGSYNGQRYTISNLYIDKASNFTGVFGYLKNAEIKNITISNADITGFDYVGILCGMSDLSAIKRINCSGTLTGSSFIGTMSGKNYYSSIDSCSNSATVTGNSNMGGIVGQNHTGTVSYSYNAANVNGTLHNVGGLVGLNDQSSNIQNCYNIGNVTGGTDKIGGLVGYNYASNINNSYSKGSVSGSGTIGGLVGDELNSATVTNSFWDTQTSTLTSSAGGTGKTTAEMQDFASFTNENTTGLTTAWDFIFNPYDDVANSEIWEMDQDGSGYPILSWQDEADYLLETLNGDGTIGNPFEIDDIYKLRWLSKMNTVWDKNFIQTADIDASGSSSWDDGDGGDAEGFSPIGNSTDRFTGSYNGQGHTINGIYINRANLTYCGFFAYSENATFSNLGLSNVDITGSYNVGGMVGTSSCTFNNCFVSGSVSGKSAVGGFVGYHNNGPIKNCYSKTNITRTSGFATYFGGFAGLSRQNALIENCYSTGSITYSNDTNPTDKGFVGHVANTPTFNNNFFDSETSQQSSDAEGTATAKTSAEMKNPATFTSVATNGLNAAWDFISNPNNDAANDDIWDMDQDGTGYPVLSWQDEADDFISIPMAGSGTQGDPYQIATLSDLKFISERNQYWDKYYIQTADIDASETSTWNSGEGFSPIGTSSVKFTGSYNGQSHFINNLFINRPSTNFIALFGYNSAATIENLAVLNANITGKSGVGAIVGENNNGSIVHSSYSTGSVISTYNSAGGLVGGNENSSQIINSYSTCSVTASNSGAGGLAGINYHSASISNSFSTGSVSATSNAGGLIGGILNGATTSNSFWDTQTSGQASSADGKGKTTAQMQEISTFTDAGWDLENETSNGTKDIWNLLCGYPYLSWQSSYEVNKPEGSGTEEDPYQIATLCDLYWLSQADTAWSRHYLQTADIDASESTNWDNGKGFSPIGNASTLFLGTYRGNGKTIDALYINRPNDIYIGLFGLNYGTIDSLGLTNVNITGSNYTGAITGSFDGSTEISASFATGTVNSGGSATGGFIGRLQGSSKLNNCYAQVEVNGNISAGGLVGLQLSSSEITNSYSTGKVSGNTNVGGLIGLKNAGTTINSFWDKQSSGQQTSAAGSGTTSYDIKATATFTNTSTSGLDAAWDFNSNPYDDAANENIWGINPNGNNGYPFLTWQGYSHTPDAAPAVTTQDVSISSLPNGTGNGTITDLGFPHAISYGICWNTTGSPTIADSKSVEDTAKATGAFTSAITGLSEGTTYYYRAYATNNAGTVYGNELNVTTKQSQDISFSALTDATYGDADITPTVSASSSLAVSLSSSDENIATIVDGKIHIIGVGSVTITASQAGDASYYAAAQVEQTLTINTKELSISGLSAANKTYDGTTAASVSGATLSGIVGNDNVTLSETTATFNNANVGSSKTVTLSTYTLSGDDAANYTLKQPATLTADITKAELTVSAIDTAKTYGANNPAFALNYTGFVNNEDSTVLNTLPKATCLADTASNAGTYDIIISGGVADNYSFTYVNATLTVNKAPLTITADAKSRVYGAENPNLTANFSGFVNSQDSSVLNSQPVLATTATRASGIGSYEITASGAAATNYEITYTTGSLTIAKATLTATAENKIKTYGSANPEFTISYTGFVNNDDTSVFTTSPTASSTATASSSVGSYNISIFGGVADNYNFSYVAGMLTVEQASLTVTADNKTKTYGEANPALTFTISGFVNNDDASSLTTAPTAITLAADSSNAGSYNITVSGGVATNYSLTYAAGTLTVNKANQTVSIETISEKLSTDVPFDVVASTTSSLELAYSIISGPATISGSTITLNGTIGTVTVQAKQAGNENYFDDSASVSFEVVAPEKQSQTITFTAIEAKTYGDSFELTASASSGLAVNYSIVSGSAEINNSTITFTSAGEVVIEASQAGNETYETATAVQQTVTVNKVSLTITAVNTSKNEGEANPEFELMFDGFILGDTSDDLDEFPTISCDADETSIAGSYDIVVSGGSDDNYAYSLVNGILTVNETVGVELNSLTQIKIYPNPAVNVLNIETPDEDAIQTVEIFNQMGKRVYFKQIPELNIDVSSFKNGAYLLRLNGKVNFIFMKE